MDISAFSFLVPTIDKNQEPTKTHVESNWANKEKVTRRKPKGQTPQKTRKRGLGVAQLELLRQQELTNNNQAMESTAFQPVPGPLNSVPAHFGAMNLGGGVIDNGGFLAWDNQADAGFKRVMNGGYNGGGIVGSSSRVLGNPYMVGSGRNEASDELSSMPKMMMVQQGGVVHEPIYCEFCLKKKKFTEDQNMRHKFSSYGISPINDSDYFGLNLGHNNINNNFNRDMNYGSSSRFGARAARSATLYADYNPTEVLQGVDVLAVHRKENSCNYWGRGNSMEYHEFFPTDKKTNNGKAASTYSKKSGWVAEASVAAMEGGGGGGGGEANSCVTSSDYSGCSASNASNSVDLSLKLSY